MKYLEYIQTNGLQVIDTDIEIPIGTNVEIEMWFTPLALENYADGYHPFLVTQGNLQETNHIAIGQYGGGHYTTSAKWGIDFCGFSTHSIGDFYCGTKYHAKINNTGFTLDDTVISTYSQSITQNQFGLYVNGGHLRDNARRQTAQYGEIIITLDGVIYSHLYPALDNSNVPCMYDSVRERYFYDYREYGFVAGPVLSTIFVDTDKLTYPASGSVATISVESETNWTVSASEQWVTLSTTGGTPSDTALTVTFPSYTGDTKRSVTLTFTNAEDTDTLTLYQKKYSAGVASEVYVADTNITELYLGDKTIENIYIGDIEVYSSGPFIGLKVSPQSVSLSNTNTAATITVKSSEPWTISSDAQWLTLSVTGGTTGKTQVSMTATQTESDRTATITVSSSTYSATCSVTQKHHIVPYNEIWIKTVNDVQPTIQMPNSDYFTDSNGNKNNSTLAFDSNKGMWVYTFENDVCGSVGAIFRNCAHNFIEMWFPSTFVNCTDDFAYYGSGNPKYLMHYYGDSPAICGSNKALTDSANVITSCVKADTGELIISNGVVGLGPFYSLAGTLFSTITLPSTLTNFGGQYTFEVAHCTTINCYATTCPTPYSGNYSSPPSNVTFHYPAGSDYSALQSKFSNWTFIGDL